MPSQLLTFEQKQKPATKITIMKNKANPGLWLITALAFVALTVNAQTDYYKTNNNDNLELASSWTNGVVTGTPPGALDTAIWDSQVSAAANCSNTLGTSINWGGVRVLDPAAPVKVTSSSTLSIDALGIDLNEPSTTQDLWLALSVTTTADQNWTIKPGRTLMIGDTSRNVNLQNNVAVNGRLVYMNNLRVQSGGTLWITNSATSIEPGASAYTSTPIIVGNNNTGINTVFQTAGTVKPKRTDGTSTSPNSVLNIGSASSSTGIYTITGGSLIDVSPNNNGYFLIGSSASSTGTLNVDGTASVQGIGLRMANNSGVTATLNLTNGTISLGTGNFDIGRTTSAAYNSATVNVYGGALTALGPVNVPHGNGPGYLNIFGGTVTCGGNLQLQDSSGGTGSGTVTVSGGVLVVTNNIGLPQAGASGATGTFNLDGGTVTVTAFTHPSVNTGTLNLNGGTLKPRSSSASFIANGILANIMAGGAVIDTASFSPTVPAALLNGTGGGADGGLTKLGLGVLTLGGANTYTGPTIINAGGLSLTTTNHGGGGPIALGNSTLLHVTVSSAGSTLNCSSLALGTLGASGGGVLTNEFDLNGFASTSIPVVHAASLTATGTVYVSVLGSDWAVATYPLIKYDNATVGSDFAFTNTLISGAVGYVTNDTSARSVNLVITGIPNLIWRAQVNTNWDTTTANWVDAATLLQTTYPNGAAVLFDDTASNGLVYATAEYAPAAMVINNPTTNYAFTGVGRIRGITGLLKDGAAAVTMGLTNNDYSGDTVISNGTFRLATGGVIPDGTGKGNVTLEGKLDLAGFNEGINGLSGYAGVVDNSGATPATFTVGNGGASGTFAGQITNSGSGSLALTKAGGGTLVLLSKNGYSGGTAVGGTLQLAYEESIGTGPLSIGGTLLWMDTAAHTLNNPLSITGGSTFGADTNGPLTVPGTANFAGGGRNLTCGSDVSFPNGFTNGWLSGKGGTGNLLVKSTTSHNPGTGGTGTIIFGSAATIFDNCLVIQEVGNIRIRAGADNQTSRLVITNGSSLIMTNVPSNNLRFNDGGTSANTTNIIDVAGTLTVMPSPGSNDKIQMGSSSDLVGENILNLLSGGVVQVRQVLDQCVNSYSIVNFNGGTLSPSTNDFAASFMQNLDYCYILDRGAVIDTAGWSVTIGQPMLAGGTGIGGLTKNGAGTLTLNPVISGIGSTYSGPTVINGGNLALGPNEPLYYSTNIVIRPSASLDVSGGSLSLNGRTLELQIAKQGVTLSSGEVLAGAAVIIYDGALTVTRTGDGLTGGETFKLFDALAGYMGAFTATNLPAVPAPLSWDLSGLYVDGTIKVAGSITPPSFSPVQLQNGTNLVLSGFGGSPGGTYSLLSQTNVALPLSFWTPVATGEFAADGRFTNSIVVDPTKPSRFFDIQVP